MANSAYVSCVQFAHTHKEAPCLPQSTKQARSKKQEKGADPPTQQQQQQQQQQKAAGSSTPMTKPSTNNTSRSTELTLVLRMKNRRDAPLTRT